MPPFFLCMTEEVLQESGTSSWIRDLSCSVSEIEDTGTSVNQPAQVTVPPGEAAELSKPLPILINPMKGRVSGSRHTLCKHNRILMLFTS